jgi:hypothetical protein
MPTSLLRVGELPRGISISGSHINVRMYAGDCSPMNHVTCQLSDKCRNPLGAWKVPAFAGLQGRI